MVAESLVVRGQSWVVPYLLVRLRQNGDEHVEEDEDYKQDIRHKEQRPDGRLLKNEVNNL